MQVHGVLKPLLTECVVAEVTNEYMQISNVPR